MNHGKFPRTLALVASGALLASLTVATVAAPAAAKAPTPVCGGKVATIVGTNKDDVIKGTNKRDVIAALGGNDQIIGGAGNDIICGGRGKDVIQGNKGKDVIFGAAGPDRLLGGLGPDVINGGTGNDRIDGGPGIDTCNQGQGTGLVTRCVTAAVAPTPPAPEPTPPPPPPEADFEVSLSGVGISGADVDFRAVVTNEGPDDAAYKLGFELTGDGAEFCTMDTTPSGKKPVFASGDQKAWFYEFTCSVWNENVTLTVDVEPTGGAVDFDMSNNEDSWTTLVLDRDSR